MLPCCPIVLFHGHCLVNARCHTRTTSRVRIFEKREEEGETIVRVENPTLPPQHYSTEIQAVYDRAFS